MFTPSMGHISTMEDAASVCLRGPNPAPCPRLMLCTLFTLWSHVPCSDGGSGRSSWFPSASSLSMCRCCRCLFVFRGPLFSSVASVSCSLTGRVTCLCAGLFPAVRQLRLHMLSLWTHQYTKHLLFLYVYSMSFCIEVEPLHDFKCFLKWY